MITLQTIMYWQTETTQDLLLFLNVMYINVFVCVLAVLYIFTFSFNVVVGNGSLWCRGPRAYQLMAVFRKGWEEYWIRMYQTCECFLIVKVVWRSFYHQWETPQRHGTFNWMSLSLMSEWWKNESFIPGRYHRTYQARIIVLMLG